MRPPFRPTPAAAIACLALALFGLLSASAVTGFGLALDVDLARDLHAQASPPLTELMRAASDLGHGRAVALAAAAVTAALLVRGHAASALRFAVAAAGAALNPLLKLAFERPRPRFFPRPDIAGFSFPSGHAMSSAALAAGEGELILLAAILLVLTAGGWSALTMRRQRGTTAHAVRPTTTATRE